ncbi:uncharacterized protein N7487_005276 [Penicillium crustosum]|nr:uncharacterized protein N7487_005276 [Penicillium crustosum]KAJ5410917.1 hypothetical protein N7487_005276 [Penicillium crustosum]
MQEWTQIRIAKKRYVRPTQSSPFHPTMPLSRQAQENAPAYS